MYSEEAFVDYHRIQEAIAFIKENRGSQPSLEEIAKHVHLSPYHFQRLFTRWAGISPKKFLQYLTIRYARKVLERNQSLAQVAQDAGLSGPGRLHDLFVGIEGMTPEQYRKSGSGLTLYHGFHYSPLGKYLLAVTPGDRICSLQFLEDETFALKELKNRWSAARHQEDPDRTGRIADTLFVPGATKEIHLLLRGTPFQIKVWEALLKIPFGELVSYQVIAEYIHNPGGLQAVGSAIGRNPVAYLVPCHRVIKKAGQISEYRWGSTRKAALIGWEASFQK
jgi:AraC family transcriptional regulator of adaptative response/methylated-DNA-[protein]-cysteine methyltransferase